MTQGTDTSITMSDEGSNSNTQHHPQQQQQQQQQQQSKETVAPSTSDSHEQHQQQQHTSSPKFVPLASIPEASTLPLPLPASSSSSPALAQPQLQPAPSSSAPSGSDAPYDGPNCPCCCMCSECVAARAACTDPNCTTCGPAAVRLHAERTHIAAASHANALAPHTAAAAAVKPTPVTTATTATAVSATLATAVATPVPSSSPRPQAQAASAVAAYAYTPSSAPMTATPPTPMTLAATPAPSPCLSPCCTSSTSSASLGGPPPRHEPLDEQLVAFSALLSRCLTNKAALQRMLDCGCLEQFISEHAGQVKKPQLTVNTRSPLVRSVSSHESPSQSNDDSRKYKKGSKSQPSPSKGSKRKSVEGVDGRTKRRKTNQPSIPSSSLAQSPPMSSVPALVRSNTMPNNSSIMNSPARYSMDSPRHAISSPQPSPMASSVASLPSPSSRGSKSSKPSKSKPSKSDDRRKSVKYAATASAPNTPHRSASSKLNAQPPMSVRGTSTSAASMFERSPPPGLSSISASSRASSPTIRDPYSPNSQHSAYTSSSTGSSFANTDNDHHGVSLLSPSGPFALTGHSISDSLLPSLSLPSSYADVPLDEADDEDYSLLRKAKTSNADELNTFNYRPRTLSESHPAHPLNALQDSQVFAHDFLAHDSYVTAPLSPSSSSSYHSGSDSSSGSMDAEQPNPAAVAVNHKDHWDFDAEMSLPMDLQQHTVTE